MRLPIYLDNHATTPMDPRVFEKMRPYFTEFFGNAASRSHRFGWEAEQAVERARGQCASLIGAKPKEIVFTSGATESNNLALKGVAEAYADRGDHIITVATEHKAVLDVTRRLAARGLRITYLSVGENGLIDLDELSSAITSRTILISVMFANNEIGVLQPVAEIGALAHKRGVLFHTDASQAVGKVPVDVVAQNIDLLSFTAHKIYGPKGAGALYVRSRDPRATLAPQMDGGGHERGLRSGTLNVPAIAGFGEACALCQAEMKAEAARTAALRDRLQAGLMGSLEGVRLNGAPAPRLPNNLSVSFEAVDSESLIMGISDIAVSSGSACTSATVEPSHVLRALGIGEERAHSSLRFGLGRFTTEEEIDYALERIPEVVGKLRELSPAWELR